MAKKILKLADVTEKEWVEFRKNSIGGSDCATIVGLNKFKSAYTLWAEKTGKLVETFQGNELTRQGNDLEDYVAKRFCEATDKKVRKLPHMYAHNDYPFLTANVDRAIIGENAGLECKTTSVYNKSDFENGEIPPYYYCQCMHYMSVMGYDKMYLAVLVLSKGFYWFEIERDEAEIEALVKAEIDFWENNVVSKVAPEIDGSESTYETINALYSNEEISEMSSDLNTVEEDITSYQALKAQIKLLEEEAQKAKNKIIAELGNSTLGSSQGYTVTFKPQNYTRLDSTTIKAKYPEIYKECTVTSPTKILRIKVNK